MENTNSLDQQEKLRIKMEELYRHEVKQSLENKPPNKSLSARLIDFLNSTFAIWFLSTCVVGLITFFYNKQQEKEQAKAATEQNEIEKTRRNASLVTVLLPYLASEKEKEWRMAIEVTRYLKKQGQLPDELDYALNGIVHSTDTINSSKSEQAKINAAAAVIDLGTNSSQANRADISSLPPRVYIQIANESQRASAKSLQSKLLAESFLAPGIENVGAKANMPNAIEVRYYRSEEKEEASKIIALLKGLNIGLPIMDTPQKIPGDGRGTRPRHYEIWFSK